MKKLFTLLTLALLSFGTTWAGDTGTESSGNQGSTNTTIVGKSYSLDGKFIAGKGGLQQGNMPDKGVKLRSNQGNLVFEVAAGYKITRFQFWGCGNTTTEVTIESAKVDGGSNLLGANVVLPGKGKETSGDIDLSGLNAEDNITLTFVSGSTAQIVGTWKIDYEQTAVVTQEITAVSLNGVAISSSELETLKSTKALKIDGSSFNGLGTLNVTLSSGATTVTRTIDGDNAVYTFTINSTDTYTITVTDVVKTYTKTGTVVAYSEDGAEATGANSNTVTMNGISFAMVDGSKTFQYGSGKVTLGSTVYVPLKLSTGSKVNVTFPSGYIATKVKIYGWSANGNGALNFIKETDDASAKTVGDISGDIYYATNTSDDIYPSVYEYDLDNWTSMCFNPGGSASQPFVVMEFTLSTSATATVGSTGWATFVTPAALDFTGISDLKAYIVTGHTGTAIDVTQMTGTVPANTPLLLEGVTTEVPVVASSSTDVSANLLKAGGASVSPEDGKTKYALSVDGSTAVFKKIVAATAIPAGKAYLEFNETISAPSLSFDFGNGTTGIDSVKDSEKVNGEYFNLAGQRVAQPTKGLYIVNGKKYMVK